MARRMRTQKRRVSKGSRKRSRTRRRRTRRVSKSSRKKSRTRRQRTRRGSRGKRAGLSTRGIRDLSKRAFRKAHEMGKNVKMTDVREVVNTAREAYALKKKLKRVAEDPDLGKLRKAAEVKRLVEEAASSRSKRREARSERRKTSA